MTEIEWEEKLEEVQKHSEHWYGMYKKLEKEIAELEAQVDKWLRENTGLKIHSAYVEKKLTEAKEIIKMFVNECKMCKAYPEAKKMWDKEIAKAETFLKGERKIKQTDKVQKKCKNCGGSGWVQVAPNARGIKPCPLCNTQKFNGWAKSMGLIK